MTVVYCGYSSRFSPNQSDLNITLPLEHCVGIVKYKWAAIWQNQQNECAPIEDSDQPGHPPSLIRVFAVRMKKAWVHGYPLSAHRRLWSDWADAQADLSLRWAHTHLSLRWTRTHLSLRWAHSHFVGFVMLRLILWICDGCFVGNMDVLWMTWTVCGYMWSICWGWCEVFCGCVVCLLDDMDVWWMCGVCFVDAWCIFCWWCEWFVDVWWMFCGLCECFVAVLWMFCGWCPSSVSSLLE